MCISCRSAGIMAPRRAGDQSHPSFQPSSRRSPLGNHGVDLPLVWRKPNRDASVAPLDATTTVYLAPENNGATPARLSRRLRGTCRAVVLSERAVQTFSRFFDRRRETIGLCASMTLSRQTVTYRPTDLPWSEVDMLPLSTHQ